MGGVLLFNSQKKDRENNKMCIFFTTSQENFGFEQIVSRQKRDFALAYRSNNGILSADNEFFNPLKKESKLSHLQKYHLHHQQ